MGAEGMRARGWSWTSGTGRACGTRAEMQDPEPQAGPAEAGSAFKMFPGWNLPTLLLGM